MNEPPRTPSASALDTRNAALERLVLVTRDGIEQRRKARGWVPSDAYPLHRLEEEIRALLVAAGLPEPPAFSFVDRSRRDADLCVMIPSRLRSDGNQVYASEVVPRMADALASSRLATDGLVDRIDARGIYVNLRLADPYLFGLLQGIPDLGARYGESDLHRHQSFVVDYSSPNVAKDLHAGHIRSTIIGEVLANLYEATGATVHRVNHINDLGGFGLLLEGYERWEAVLPADASPGRRLAILYATVRALANLREQLDLGIPADAAQTELMERYFGTPELTVFAERHREFIERSNERFARLEEGHPDEVARWEQMVRWSLDSFAEFYQTLGIRHDYTLGESFYATPGLQLVARARASGQALLFDRDRVAAERSRLTARLAAGELASEEFEALVSGAERDEGAIVVEVDDQRRLVVLRSDGRSIYATRDLGALEFRTRVFQPRRIIYVVGQEQQEHFLGVFQAARRLGITPPDTDLTHIHFGFYVDPRKRKLSSREGADGVHRLLRRAVEYFDSKFQMARALPPEDARRAAHQLGVGSIIIHDLRRDMRGPVEVNPDVDLMLPEFEKSGGAYLVYAACRAKNILRRAPQPIPTVFALEDACLVPAEIELIKRLLQFPAVVTRAAAGDDPSQLVAHLLESARAYNSYYHACQVLEAGTVHRHRLLLTAACARMFENGLRLCHIECPDRI